MKPILCATFIAGAIACICLGLLALQDPEGRGVKLLARFAIGAVALVACAVGMWFV